MSTTPAIRTKRLLKEDDAKKKTYKIAFCHPDLGLGGAERLIVDAAAELSKRGHLVNIYTAYYDPNRSFEETRQGLFQVTMRGNFIPRAILGRFIALCAYIRCIWVALCIAYDSTLRGRAYDVVIVDQVSVVIPILFLFTRARIVFYCHFPDLLLSQRKSLLKRLYRAPLDYIEEVTTGMADRVLVNSEFTRDVFSRTFTRLASAHVVPDILYPAVPVPPKKGAPAKQWNELRSHLQESTLAFLEAGPTFLSINRFERKKNLPLALHALKELLASHPHCNARLVMAGGYDARLAENVEHLAELTQSARSLALSDRVLFLPSFKDRERQALLEASVGVLYTPEHEHFGIVPLEAMAAGRPVIACASGGPLESILDRKTGLLCEPTPAAFAQAMAALLEPGASTRMGANAVEHVRSSFSRELFGAKLEEIVKETVRGVGATAGGREGGAGMGSREGSGSAGEGKKGRKGK